MEMSGGEKDKETKINLANADSSAYAPSPQTNPQAKTQTDPSSSSTSAAATANEGIEPQKEKKEIEIVKLFRKHGLFINSGAIGELKEKNIEIILEIIEKLKELHKEDMVMIGETELKEVTQEIKLPGFADISRPSGFRPLAKELGHDFKIHTERDISGKSKCGGDIEDFVKNVNDRFMRIKSILESRPSQNQVVKLERAKSQVGDLIRVIGMVMRKNVTKKGHLSLEIEDETGTLFILILRDDKEAFEKANKVIKDDIIAIDVKVGTNFCMAKDITWPDMPVKAKKTIEKDLSIAFISDMHIGSKYFCDKEFERMIKWLNGMGPHKEVAEKIGYILMAGDVVDGIGNYPKQEYDLVVKDVFEQYRLAQKMFEMIPDHIKIILIPGNHDAVRLAEPQPALKEEMIGKLPNVISIGNPGFANVEGLETILYHGVSIGSMSANVPGLTPARPEEAVVELLKRRNLAPIYDENDIAPEHSDYHFIGNCDMINTGHMHKNGYTEYRGCVVVTSGTWQWLTEYQVKQGHVATPCVLPIYNLKEGRIVHLNFAEEQIKML